MRSGVAFVVNPASGGGKGLRVWSALEPLAQDFGLFEAAFTERARHGVALARRFAEGGWPRIIAVGGDGTLNEVLNGAMGSDAAIGAIPVGTGNDWVRTVGVPNNAIEALRIGFAGKIASSDVGEVDGHGFFLNVMGAGFDAEVARRIGEAKGLLAKLGPTPRYIASVLRTFGSYKPSMMRITLDGETKEVPYALLIAIGIAQYYGSGMRILPDAKIDDGFFDIVWGSEIRFRELPSLMGKIRKGRHVGHPKAHFSRAQSILLDSDAQVPFHLDGDPRGFLPIRIRFHPRAIRVIVGPHWSGAHE